MNKRIRELAEQAGFTFYRGSIWASNPDCENDFYCDEEVKKFAELIVKECAGLCEREGQNPFNNVWEKTRAKCDALMIREHFGVKE